MHHKVHCQLWHWLVPSVTTILHNLLLGYLVVRLCKLKGMTPQEFFCDMRETLWKSAPAYCIIKKWHAELKRGRLSCDELHRFGWPATSVDEETVERINKLVTNDQRRTVCFIALFVGISIGSIHSILTKNLLLKKVSAWWVPRMISDVQKANRVGASTSLLCLFNENLSGFISEFLTVNVLMRPGFTTSILKAKLIVWPSNTPLLHLLENFAFWRQLAKLWQLYSGMLSEL